MRSLLCSLLFLVLGTAANAQEGFPLDGTWRGERHSEDQSAGTTVVMVIQWDGRKITGVINPGPKSLAIEDAKLIPAGWRVSIAAKNATGEPVTYEGVLSDIGKYNRTLDGTWTEGGKTYRLRLVRE